MPWFHVHFQGCIVCWWKKSFTACEKLRINWHSWLETGPRLKMYFLWKMRIFHCHVTRGYIWNPMKNKIFSISTGAKFLATVWADILLRTTVENALHDDTPNKMVYEQTLSNEETLSQPKEGQSVTQKVLWAETGTFKPSKQKQVSLSLSLSLSLRSAPGKSDLAEFKFHQPLSQWPWCNKNMGP